MLAVHNLSQSIGRVPLLHSISCGAKAGSITALLGPNGAGKTTLLRSIMGLLSTPQAPARSVNAIVYNNQIINSWTVAQRVGAGLVYLPQHPSLLSDMNVKDNLQLVFAYHPYWQRGADDDAVRANAAFIEERNRWLAITGLTEHLKKPAGVLSGGQKRKLEVVRALLMHPKIVLLDEPFAGVDPKSIYELKSLFSSMANNGIAILISDHNVDQLLSIAQFVYVIIDGKIVTSGGVEEILQDQRTRHHYFGDQFSAEMTKRYLG